MRRTVIATIMLVGSLGFLGAVYVWAYNCGDTWASEGPNIFDGLAHLHIILVKSVKQRIGKYSGLMATPARLMYQIQANVI